MIWYIIKRILYFIPTLFLAGFIVFLMIHLIPGDPALVILGDQATPENVDALRKTLGLERPLIIQFARWIGKIAMGDLGVSIRDNRPVLLSALERFPVTLTLTTLATLFSVLIAVPSGVFAAVYHKTRRDYLFMICTIFGVSIPGFWLGLMALLIFSVHLGWFPSTGYIAISEDLWEGLRYMALPSVTLGLLMTATVARMTRSSMLEVLRLEYVTHARAKGLGEFKVICKHALKNSFAPSLTTIGIQFGMLLGGAVVTETVFGLPGVGRYLILSIYARDYPVVQGYILLIALAYMLINLLVDISYPYFNPRIDINK